MKERFCCVLWTLWVHCTVSNHDTNIIAGWQSLLTHYRCHHCIRSDVCSTSR